MFADLFKELVLELLRALFLEDLCQRVKESFVTRRRRRRLLRHQALLRRLHLRNRERLLHRITTDQLPKL